MSWARPLGAMPMSEIEEENVYRAMVVDSGPIIRQTALNSLRGRAKTYFTVPAVLQEIRDARARDHLDQLPFELVPREPSHEAIQAVVEFSKKTGDYQSLSSVDLQVLGLLYDLEKEGCGTGHIRTTPKRMVGVGKIESLTKKENNEEEKKGEEAADGKAVDDENPSFFESHEVDYDYSSDEDSEDFNEETDTPKDASEETETRPAALVGPKSWASLVSPNAATNVLLQISRPQNITSQPLDIPFGKMNIADTSGDAEGQFSDADEDDEIGASMGENTKNETGGKTLEKELQTDFPSLHAAATVPYEGSDDEDDHEDQPHMLTIEELEERKKQSLQPVSKSGKMYNSFRKYGNLMKPKAPARKETESKEDPKPEMPAAVPQAEPNDDRKIQSRIMGGTGMSGQETEFEDDGEGWITNSRDIRSMKAQGTLDPARKPSDKNAVSAGPAGPPVTQRTACTTTDFAMQNVILQMNLELVSVDGVKIRRLKSWVTRCGACFRIYSNGSDGPNGMKRLFCAHCGSDVLQRIAASVDGKTGRLRLHLSKNHKNNLRGTKFSLPKPGTGNRFQGDLLLREDQLLMGAWQQKVKLRSGGKSRAAAESIFGKDLASNVGCNPNAISSEDIRVGFGRRNPNAAKGRERRGKKKKSTDRACGLHRY